jgi:hypothetical protein
MKKGGLFMPATPFVAEGVPVQFWQGPAALGDALLAGAT